MDSLLSGLALSMLLRSVYAVAGTVSLPIEVQKSPQLTHRATGVKDVTLVNNQSDMSDRYYGIKIDVGTPYQELSLALNTRSSDTCKFCPVIQLGYRF